MKLAVPEFRRNFIDPLSDDASLSASVEDLVRSNLFNSASLRSALCGISLTFSLHRKAFGFKSGELALDFLVSASFAWIIPIAPKLHRSTLLNVSFKPLQSNHHDEPCHRHESVFHLGLLPVFGDFFVENSWDSDLSGYR